LRPIDILTGEIAIEVIGVVGVSPALWYLMNENFSASWYANNTKNKA
jgi:hypothetical protein